MSFIADIRDRLVKDKSVYDLSRNSEFLDFYFIGFKETPVTIDFVTFVEADELTERQIVDLRDKFFNAVQAVSYDFGLKPMARNPNGLLAFVFQETRPSSVVAFIQKQTKANSFGKSAVIVSWAIDVQGKKIYTHNNPVSIMPPIFIMEQTVFPGLGFLKNALEQYVEPKLLASTKATAQEVGNRQSRQEKYREPSLGEDFATQLRAMQGKIEEIFRTVSRMSDQPKYSFPNAQKVQVFERVNTYIENQEGANQAELMQALEDLKQEVATLQQKHPQITTEPETQAIIEAEFLEIQRTQPQRWRNLLQLKRWLNGLKSGTFNVGEHFAEETAWGKAALGFLEGFTDEVD